MQSTDSQLDSAAQKAGRRGGWGVFFLQGLTLGQLIATVWRSSLDDDIADRAAELAYYFLFSLFPGLIVLSAMFSLFASTRARSDLELMLYLGKVIPPGAFNMVQSTFTATTAFTATRNLVVGAIFSLWSATYGMSSAQSILNVVFRVKETRPYWKAKLIALLLTLAIFVLVFTAMVLLLVGDYVMKFFMHIWLADGMLEILWKIARFCAAIFLMNLVFSLTYHWGPDRREHRWRWVSPGAVVGVIAWVAASIGFRFYLHFFNSYARLYGSLGAVIVLLTWFYVSGLVLLLGAEINANLGRAAARASRRGAAT
jgi:membrane protein